LIKAPEAVLAAQMNWLMLRALGDTDETLERGGIDAGTAQIGIERD